MIFRTPYFSTSGSSVLHSGIYNREFSSMLASMAAGAAAYALAAFSGSSRVYAFGVLVLAALLTFPLFRRYIFKDLILATTFDSTSGRIRIIREGFRRKLVSDFPLADLTTLLIETKKPVMGDSDAMDFVKKISLQHNTPIPGFGDEAVLYMLTLKLANNADRVIFACSSMQDALSAHEGIKMFLEKNNFFARGTSA